MYLESLNILSELLIIVQTVLIWIKKIHVDLQREITGLVSQQYFANNRS